VPTDLVRKDGRINYAEALDAEDTQARVNNAGIERSADARSRRLRKARELASCSHGKEVPLTGWNAALQCSKMNSLISSSVICATTQWKVGLGVLMRQNSGYVGVGLYTYTIGIRVAQVEKVFGIGRVGLGFEDVLDTVGAADTHGESHTAYKYVHIVF